LGNAAMTNKAIAPIAAAIFCSSTGAAPADEVFLKCVVHHFDQTRILDLDINDQRVIGTGSIFTITIMIDSDSIVDGGSL
jgi:hypothetical protein